VSKSFNVANLSPFFGLEESRTTPFQGGGWYDHASTDSLSNYISNFYRTYHS
jgi:hypothetical protein